MRSKKNKTYNKLRKSVKAGEICIVPSDNRLIEMGEEPYVNGPKKRPAWFRLSPKNGIKRCSGIKDFFDIGITIPAWTTFRFVPDELTGRWDVHAAQFSVSNTIFGADFFPYEMTGECPMTGVRSIENSPYPKLVTPYAFITAPGWSTIELGIMHEPNPNYDIVAGIVHTDFYHQINVVLNIKTDKEFIIPHNEPLVHLVPFKRTEDFGNIKMMDESDFKYVYGVHSDVDVLGPTESGWIAREYRKARRLS
jgi:hypothetical protein